MKSRLRITLNVTGLPDRRLRKLLKMLSKLMLLTCTNEPNACHNYMEVNVRKPQPGPNNIFCSGRNFLRSVQVLTKIRRQCECQCSFPPTSSQNTYCRDCHSWWKSFGWWGQFAAQTRGGSVRRLVANLKWLQTFSIGADGQNVFWDGIQAGVSCSTSCQNGRKFLWTNYLQLSCATKANSHRWSLHDCCFLLDILAICWGCWQLCNQVLSPCLFHRFPQPHLAGVTGPGLEVCIPRATSGHARAHAHWCHSRGRSSVGGIGRRKYGLKNNTLDLESDIKTIMFCASLGSNRPSAEIRM